MSQTIVAALIGITAGVVSGLFGIGGGLVFVPGLVLILGFEQHRAHATSSAAVVVTATTGAIRFFDGGAADLRSGGLLACGAILGALVGATLMGKVPSKRLKALFALVAAVAAIRLTLGGLGTSVGVDHIETTLGTMIGIVLLGMATGTLMSMLGLGGGLVYVPILALVFGLEQHIAQGTSLVAIVPTAASAAIVHYRAHRVDLPIALILGTGSIVGVLLGALLAFSLAGSTLQFLFSGLLVLAAGLQLFRKS
ncbi:MAG: TSUP family transporter [Gammaproteobacteria bacterium]|nr:TSUP family transporter [Gammaproteobacteria bacterium]